MKLCVYDEKGLREKVELVSYTFDRDLESIFDNHGQQRVAINRGDFLMCRIPRENQMPFGTLLPDEPMHQAEQLKLTLIVEELDEKIDFEKAYLMTIDEHEIEFAVSGISTRTKNS